MWWDDPSWEEHFAALERYKDGDGKGDPNCPAGHVVKDTSPPLNLGTWLSHQRQAKKGTGMGKISDEQIRRLEELGVWWDDPAREQGCHGTDLDRYFLVKNERTPAKRAANAKF